VVTQPAEGVLVGARYTLERRVAERRWGSIWLAHDQTTGCLCAVRLADGDASDVSELARRYRDRMETVAQIRCENVLDCLDCGQWQGIPFLVMEHQEGERLRDRIQRQGRLDPGTAYAIVSQVACALGRAHAVGIVHGDLSPEHILLVQTCQGEVAKVLEFGCPCPDIYGGVEQHGEASDQAWLPCYASPERLRAAPLDWHTDCWSLAVIAYECLSGKRPFQGDSMGDLLTRILHEPVPAIPLPESGPSMWVHRWWKKASAREPNRRFQSAKELADALGSALRLPRLPVPALEPRAALPGPEPAISAADPLPVLQPIQHPRNARPPTLPTMRLFWPLKPQPVERGGARSCPEPPRNHAEAAAASDQGEGAMPCTPSPDRDTAAQRDGAPSLARRRLPWIRAAAPASLLALVLLIALGWLVRVQSAEENAVPASSRVSAPSPSSLARSAATVPRPQALATSPPETTVHQADPVRIPAVHDSQDGPTVPREISTKPANQGQPPPGSKNAREPRAPAATRDYGI
jgi:serine/threonine protein kinase